MLTLKGEYVQTRGITLVSFARIMPFLDIHFSCNSYFYWAGLQWARHRCYNSNSMYVHPCVCVSVCIHPPEFVWTITSTIVDGFQNNLTQLLSITCRCAIWNIPSARPKVKVALEAKVKFLSGPELLQLWMDFKVIWQFFSITCRYAIWNMHSGRL